LNAQCLIEDEDTEDTHAEVEEPQDEGKSEYSNSWGGSQYDHPEEDDHDQMEHPMEDVPEGEDDDEVHISTMHAM
jgi:hypothetical protein